MRYTVKLVYKDHPRDQQNVLLIHRWSLYAGLIAWRVYTMGPVKCGLYKQVVFIYRWCLEQVWLYVDTHSNGHDGASTICNHGCKFALYMYTVLYFCCCYGFVTAVRLLSLTWWPWWQVRQLGSNPTTNQGPSQPLNSLLTFWKYHNYSGPCDLMAPLFINSLHFKTVRPDVSGSTCIFSLGLLYSKP